jgi:transposase
MRAGAGFMTEDVYDLKPEKIKGIILMPVLSAHGEMGRMDVTLQPKALGKLHDFCEQNKIPFLEISDYCSDENKQALFVWMEKNLF